MLKLATLFLLIAVGWADLRGTLCSDAVCDRFCLDVQGAPGECIELGVGSALVTCTDDTYDYEFLFYAEAGCEGEAITVLGELDNCTRAGDSGAYFKAESCSAVEIDTTSESESESEEGLGAGTLAGYVAAVAVLGLIVLLITCGIQYAARSRE